MFLRSKVNLWFLQYCLYHKLISHLIENYFVVMESKIHDLIDNRVITLPHELVKAPANLIILMKAHWREITLKHQQWRTIRSRWRTDRIRKQKANKKKGSEAIVKVSKRKESLVAGKAHNLVRSLMKLKKRVKVDKKAKFISKDNLLVQST